MATIFAPSNPLPSTPVKTTKEQADGLSPVSIFADLGSAEFVGDDKANNSTQKNNERAARLEMGKTKASRRSELWNNIHDETKGDWDAMHAALQQQLTGKVELDWAVPIVTPKAITLQPPTEADFTLMATKLEERLNKRKELLAQVQAKVDKLSFTDEEKAGIKQEFDVIRMTEDQRWSQVTKQLGSNALQFPILNAGCQFNTNLPSLRVFLSSSTKMGGPCTEAEMKSGAWGIEHKTLAATDVNAVPFNLIRREMIEEEELVGKETTTFQQGSVEIQVNPSTELRTFFTKRSAVHISKEEMAAGVWGIEHKTLAPQDANAMNFPLQSAWSKDGEHGVKDEISSVTPVQVDPSTLREELHASSDTEFYSETDSECSACFHPNQPEWKLDEKQEQYFATGWAEEIATKRDGAQMLTSIDENRLCQWKYFNRTDLISSNKTLKKQDSVWKSREERKILLTPKSIRWRIQQLNKHFGGKRVDSFFAPIRDNNFTMDVIKVSLPEEREEKLQALAASELEVGWYGSLRCLGPQERQLPAAPYDLAGKDENRLSVWRYYTRIDLIATDKTLPSQDQVWSLREKKKMTTKSIRWRIQQLNAHFGGKRVESFFAPIRDENLTLDVIKVSLPENCAAFWAAIREREQVEMVAREKRIAAMFELRSSRIAFYKNRDMVIKLLAKKDTHFMRPRTPFKFLPMSVGKEVTSLTLQSLFFAEFLKCPNQGSSSTTTSSVTVVENSPEKKEEEDGSAHFVEEDKAAAKIERGALEKLVAEARAAYKKADDDDDVDDEECMRLFDVYQALKADLK